MDDIKIGDVLWLATTGQREKIKPCPVCYGKKEVMLILGNGDEVITPCAYCSLGFNPPTGHVHEWEYVVEPKLIVIDSIRKEETATGTKIELYYDRCYATDISKIFKTREDAEIKCAELVKEREIEQNTKAEYLKSNQAKSYSWNVGYYMRNVRDMEKKIEWYKDRARLCKAKSKDGDNE